LKFLCQSMLLVSLLPAVLAQDAEEHVQLHNPVARCADSGVFAHRGRYYISGVGLPGQMLVSSDLVHWEGPYKVFERESQWTETRAHLSAVQDLHAPSIEYVNGVFHFYWNGIGHAVARDPLGPYREPVLEKRFDGEIDPFLFAGPDGSFTFYTVKFDRGNVIYGQEMEGPSQLRGEPKELLRAAPGTWEMRHACVIEGPEVFWCRNLYHMLYAANHTSTRFGQYAIGYAQAETPLGFNEASKKKEPVMNRNEFLMEQDAQILVPTGTRGGSPWRYTLERPGPGWEKPGFQGTITWEEGRGGFGWPVRPQSQVHCVNTVWEPGQGREVLYLRKLFSIQTKPSPHLKLRIRHIQGVQVYLNGVLAYEADGRRGPLYADVSEEAIVTLDKGPHLIAARVQGGNSEERFFDLGLVDFLDHEPDDLVWNTGQPNVVRGPNGFERYLVYFGIWNDGPHSQGINRIHFFGRDLFVEGPTGARPLQYCPRPHPPNWRDAFDTHDNTIGEDWDTKWEVQQKNISSSGVRVLPRMEPASEYLFQAWAQSLPGNELPYGLVVVDENCDRFLRVMLDPKNREWRWEFGEEAAFRTGGGSLPPGFNFEVYHKLRLEKNRDLFYLWIDPLHVTLERAIQVPFASPCRPGLFSGQDGAAFDAVLYTRGWDESGREIRGWREAAPRLKETLRKTSWIGEEGLVVEGYKKGSCLVKGDLWPSYDFTVQVSGRKRHRTSRMGVYAVYVDEQNHLAVWIQEGRDRLWVTGVKEGKTLDDMETNLHPKNETQEENSYNLRIVKLPERVLVFLDGEERLESPGMWPNSCVGLGVVDMAATFDGITAFRLGSDP